MIALYEVNISLKEGGHATIDLELDALMYLIENCRLRKTTFEEYYGFHRDYENNKDVIRWAIAALRPCDIISITADEILIDAELPEEKVRP